MEEVQIQNFQTSEIIKVKRKKNVYIKIILIYHQISYPLTDTKLKLKSTETNFKSNQDSNKQALFIENYSMMYCLYQSKHTS